MSCADKVLDLLSVNHSVRNMRLVRGIQQQRAKELQQELNEGVVKPFKEFFYADIGDAQAMGQKPITFLRQVVSLCLDNTKLETDPDVPADVKDRVTVLLNSLLGKSIGVYSGESGIPLVRKHVAEFIERRDGGGFPADPDNIVFSNGASGAIVDILSLFASEVKGEKVGVLTPVPQYPLYKNAIARLDLQQVDYYLDEDHGWSLTIPELENAVNNARKSGCQPKVLVVINPGNPTGQVLTRECIEDVIRFAYHQKLYIFADEVYQQNVFQEEVPFHSFRKVMLEMGAPYSSMELASFMSVSKGYAGECGFRGGYVELFNPSPEIRALYNTILGQQLCPSAIGQVAMDCVVKEPQQGDPSYERFIEEKNEILESQRRRSEMISEAFNTFKRVTCNRVMGAMYAYPRLHLPERAIQEAERRKMAPDSFYVIELINATGICVAPGSAFGQRQDTYHLRMTILGEEERIKKCLQTFKEFNDAFMAKYE